VVTRTVENGKSKYYINGKTETAEKVKSLFCSVKLNINNPHFLIMQGRVTKVINMKPKEVLGLIEEAAGISLY
jgi:structural maintenance of chromosome 2